MDAIAQAELVRSGAASPVELVRAAIDRIEALDPAINAVVHRRFDAALAEAASPELPDGAFRGVPLLLKDAGAAMAGEPHHVGVRALRDAGWVEPDTSPLAAWFVAKGFVVVGRTNVPELCAAATTESLAYGPARNPHDTRFSTGGSSGGSAAAVAAGMVAVAHASDTGGSIRMPAACCGVVGLKPSRAPSDWPLDPMTYDGVVTRSVRDQAAVWDLRLPEVGPLRIGVRDAPVAADLLADLGHHVADGGPAGLDDPDLRSAYGVLRSSGLARTVDRWEQRTGLRLELEPWTQMVVDQGRTITAPAAMAAAEALQDHADRIRSWWGDHDLYVTPTIAHAPFEIGHLAPDVPVATLAERYGRFRWLTPPWSVTGQPALSLPLHWTDTGMPRGTQLIGAPGADGLVLAVAAQLEGEPEGLIRPVA